MTNPSTPSVGGSSKIELDNRLLNSLLAIFVNKPGGLQVQIAEQGNLQVQQGDLQVGVDPFTLAQSLRVQLRNGNLGPFVVQLNQLQLGPQGLTISLNLQT
ncbi:hypothetical protein IV102_10540 [bacterium]|nr:hypothetical protein [bacterium]